MHVEEAGKAAESYEIRMQAVMVETTSAIKQNKSLYKMKYLKYSLNLPTKMVETPAADARLKNATQHFGKLNAMLVVDANNRIEDNIADLSKVPADAKPDMADLHGQMQASLEMLAAPLPGRVVQPGEQWKAARELFVFSGDRGDLAPMVVTYTYQGVEIRNTRKEAVFSIAGVASGNLGQDLLATGRLTGKAAFDVQAGQLSLCDVTAHVQLEKQGKGKLSATLTSKLVREMGDEILNQTGQLTADNKKDPSGAHYNVHWLEAEAGKRYFISLESRPPETPMDMRIVIINGQGGPLTASDKLHAGPVTYLELRVTSSAKVGIVATTHQPGVTGNYQVAVRNLPPAQ
jgi:hypothetical protein